MRNFFLIILLSGLVGCGVGKCQRDSDGANFARSLPAERLLKLYNYSKKLAVEERDRYYFDTEKNPLPSKISDLPVKIMRVQERQVLYRLQGCLDHHLDLVVIKTGENAPRIELRSEEAPKIIEVLWKQET